METERGTPSAGLGPWTKVLLWSLVFVFGVLYLSSGKRGTQTQSPTTAGATTEVPVSSEPPASGTSPGPEGRVGEFEGGGRPPAADEGARGQAVEGPASASPSAQTGALADPREPLRAAESAAFADSLLAKEPSEGSGEGTAGQRGTSADVAPEGGVSVGPAAPPTPASAGPAAPADLGSKAPRAMAAPTPVGEAGSAARAEEPREAARARILMEYEAMRRAAEEEMRRTGQQMGVPAPGVIPSGPPGYAPVPGGFWGH